MHKFTWLDTDYCDMDHQKIKEVMETPSNLSWQAVYLDHRKGKNIQTQIKKYNIWGMGERKSY